jgi:hypothetical protein
VPVEREALVQKEAVVQNGALVAKEDTMDRTMGGKGENFLLKQVIS